MGSESKNKTLTDRPLFPVGVNVFVIREGALLLGRRRSAGYHDGEWGLPGGHLEEGESMMGCARRELMEETGIVAEAFTFTNADNDMRQDGYHYVHFGFLANDAAGDAENKEPDKCYGWDWFPLDALPDNLFIGHKKLIRGFIEGRPFNEE